MERLGIKKYNPKITQFNKMKAKIIFMATLAAAVLRRTGEHPCL